MRKNLVSFDLNIWALYLFKHMILLVLAYSKCRWRNNSVRAWTPPSKRFLGMTHSSKDNCKIRHVFSCILSLSYSEQVWSVWSTHMTTRLEKRVRISVFKFLPDATVYVSFAMFMEIDLKTLQENKLQVHNCIAASSLAYRIGAKWKSVRNKRD